MTGFHGCSEPNLPSGKTDPTPPQTLTKSYAPNFFELISGTEFLATAPFGANDSITIQVTSGSAIVYGVTADNTTQDPSIQFAT